MRWLIAPADEFVGVWNPLDSIRLTSSWVSGFLINSGSYLMGADVDGHGAVDINDLNDVRKRLGTHLP